MERKIFNTPEQNDAEFDNFKFNQVKIGEQLIPFANYEEDTPNHLACLYNWYNVNVIWMSKSTETIIIKDEEGNYSPWEFNNNDGFKLLSEDAETIWEAFTDEKIYPRVPVELKKMPNYTYEHLRILGYNE